jgi:NAD(P)-dependent dehydrogenase (short-subunit alcohol dehydrogenase family)
MAEKVVWVSGASSGLGRAAAAALKAAGWLVIAGARSFVGNEYETDCGTRLPLDVRDADSVRVFCEQAYSLAGAPDAIVNAAAVLTIGPAEETAPEEFLAVMDTVLMGAIRFTQAALPMMRSKGGGKVVMLSSVNGLYATPYQGPYTAAKHALEGYSECLMLETRKQGIQVMLVEPGDHSGGAQKYRGQAEKVSPLYRESLGRVMAAMARDEAQGQSPERFGRRLALVLSRKRLPARLRVLTLKEQLSIVLHDVLPGRWFQRIVTAYFKV